MGLIKILHWKVEVIVRDTLLISERVGVEPAHPVEVRRKWVSCITEERGVKHFSLKQQWMNGRVYKNEKWEPSRWQHSKFISDIKFRHFVSRKGSPVLAAEVGQSQWGELV